MFTFPLFPQPTPERIKKPTGPICDLCNPNQSLTYYMCPKHEKEFRDFIKSNKWLKS